MDAGKVYMTERGPIPWPETSVNAPEEWESAEGFGLSVALDEDTALVGAPSAEPGAIPDQGAAYVFTRSGSSWSEQQTLSAGDGAAEDDFGAAVAVDGSTAIVGATGAGDNGQGAAYVFTFDGASWTEQQQLTAGDGAPGDGFGGALALDGATLIVGASWAGDIGQGAAYVFTFNGASWSELQMLTAGDGAVDDYFGASVALDGDTAVVGAAGANVGDNDDQGAAYVFYRDGGVVWSEQQKLTAGDGTEDDEFGSSVALAGDTAIILAHSPEDPDIANVWAAYVFTRDGDGEWSEVQKLMAGDAGRADGANVAMSGGTAIVGVPLAVVGTNVPQGAAYIFRQGDAGWSWEQKLLAGNGAPGAGETYDLFGSAVALDGNTALVGAPGYTDVPLPNERARVHFFERTVGGYHTYLPVALNQ
jgi:hypothetical protein